MELLSKNSKELVTKHPSAIVSSDIRKIFKSLVSYASYLSLKFNLKDEYMPYGAISVQFPGLGEEYGVRLKAGTVSIKDLIEQYDCTDRLERVYELAHEKVTRAHKKGHGTSFTSAVKMKKFNKTGKVIFKKDGVYPGSFGYVGISSWAWEVDEFLSYLMDRFVRHLLGEDQLNRNEILAYLGFKGVREESKKETKRQKAYLKKRNPIFHAYLTDAKFRSSIPLLNW